ncbi:Peroxisome biogenesis factor 2 [Eufriesea mexicana]|uniref:RING-type E3 ubiquitin transferase (cysteine targeting) n=1 Tax=Eufriesea mexicana TaxID=516756 RepID=A0A310SNB4_9HYME|nr:PREDICTED: peroxisome biogenesis factor 2 [Eufriesea mexicana]OAD57008.1 Peroxisome biogenesis factor 2 [Eufriesea mexicana]
MPPSPYVSRINQIDAVQLDEEIYKVLRNQAREIGKYQPIEKIDRWQPEIDALLKYLVWNFSLRRGKSTFGQQLLDLHYENITGPKSVLYAIFTIGPAYVRDKLANATGANPNFTAVLDHVADLAKLLEFLNLLIFLHRGTQPRVVEYLLGIASSSSTVHKPRNIGYSYMTRELLWHSLMELFTTGLPMLNLHYFKHALKKLFARARRVRFQRSFPLMDSTTRCAYCGDTPILPMHAGCRHIFCYYCLNAHFTATNEFQCTECDARLAVHDMKTYQAKDS